MKKIKKVVIGIISAMSIMFLGVVNNIGSCAAEFSENIQVTEQLPDGIMPLVAGTYSTQLIENNGKFRIDEKKVLNLYQKVIWTYGGATGEHPIASVYDFVATPSSGYVYEATVTRLREEVYVEGKKGTRYTEKGIYSKGKQSYIGGVYVECNYDGGHRENVINQ